MSQDSVNAPESPSNFIHPVNLKFACKQPTGLLLLHWCFAVYPLDSYLEPGGAILGIFPVGTRPHLPQVDESVSDAICSATSRAPCYCEVSSPGEHPHPPGPAGVLVTGDRDFTGAFERSLQVLALSQLYMRGNWTGSAGQLQMNTHYLECGGIASTVLQASCLLCGNRACSWAVGQFAVILIGSIFPLMGSLPPRN